MIASPAARPRRLPGLVHMLAAVLVLLTVLTIALRAAQTSPPAVAEFAPQAQQIRQAPAEQQPGHGGGLPGGPGAVASPAPSPSQLPGVPAGAVVYPCVGDPPRQIEDPQSPPCVPYWVGQNGGATAKGVTGSEITVAIDTSEYSETLSTELPAFFNKRFELYGRQIQIKTYTASNPCYSSDPGFSPHSATSCGTPADMEADAQAIDQTIGPFADLGYSVAGNGDGSEYVFYDKLAARHILSVEFPSHEGATYMDEGHLDQFAPYEWNYLPAFDKDMVSMGRFICAQLAHRAPRYAGSPQNQQAQRGFGLIVQNYGAGAEPDTGPLTSEAAACGVPITTVRYDPNTGGETNAILQLEGAHVTSVVCICHVNVMIQSFMAAADSQRYFPEWLIQNFGTQDDEFELAEEAPRDQVTHVLGLMGFNKWQPGADRPVSWAVNDVDPGQCPSNCYDWELWAPYWELLVLASGIQMAGPDLTPATFQQGLFKASYPNPGCGAAPWYQACAGFGPHDHTLNQDFAMVWWDPNQPQTWRAGNGPQFGAYCYIAQGRRYYGAFPTQPEPFFDTTLPCR